MRYIKIGTGAYQLVDDDSLQTRILGYSAAADLYSLDESGTMTLSRHFAWDGPTGAANTRDFIMGSAYHDAGCEMIRRGMLPVDLQPMFDQLMDEINATPQLWTDGERRVEILMKPFRRAYSYIAVRLYQYFRVEKNHRATVYQIQFRD